MSITQTEKIAKDLINKYYKVENEIESVRVDTHDVPEELSDTLNLIISDLENTLNISTADVVSLINTLST